MSAEAPDHIAFDQLGKAMLESAGGDISVYMSQEKIKQYILGDMTSTVYWVNGSFEDWSYAGGWDTASGGVFK